jgi:tetratricopeptide (TPR) repeat protein
MPSHTFTRVGMWEESVMTNQRSVEAAKADSNAGEMLHASDYMVYAYLQMRKDSAAKVVMDGLPALLKTYDLSASGGAANAATGAFALAAIPARYALERRRWPEAAMLQTRSVPAAPQTEAISNFARALGNAHTGDLSRANSAIVSLVANQEKLTAMNEAYWAEQVAIQILEARAAVDFADKRTADALQQMKEAVNREDATEKAAVTPGPLAPAHELLGDMYLDLHRSAEALVEYRACLQREPNRFRSLYGAMKAASGSGDKAAAAEYARQIEQQTGSTSFTR